MNNNEYAITLAEAKLNGVYTFKKDLEFSELKEQIETQTFDVFNPKGNVPFIVQFGNIDIELSVLDSGNNDGKYDIGYYVCYKHSNGWESHGYTDTSVDLNVKDEDIEEFMFNDMIKYAEKNELTWSEINE